MRRIVLIILMLAGFVAKSQNPFVGKYYRMISWDTTSTQFTNWTEVPNTGGFYYNSTTGYVMVKDATGYHKLPGPGGGGGGGGGTIVAVNGTTNRIDATGTTTRTLDISATFEALLGKKATGLSQFAATTSAELRGVLSDETGTGVAYFAGGNAGTPSAINLTNATGMPVSGLSSGTSAQLRSILTDETGTGAAYFVGGALGTPASVTLTNGTGLPITGVTSSTSAQLQNLLSDDQGTGALYFGPPTGANTTFAVNHTLGTNDVGNNLSGIVRITGSSPTTITVPTNTTAAITINSLISVINESSDTITVAFAVGVTHVDNGDYEIPPYGVGSFYKTAINTWTYIGGGTSGGGGGGISACKMEVGTFTTAKILNTDDIASCNNTGFWTYTGAADVNVTVPLYSSQPFEAGSNIAINNQSAYTITVVFTGGVTGGGHTYNTILAGESAVIYWRAVDVVDLLGTRAPTEDLVATATLDFGSTVAGAISDLTISVTGAVVGDLVALGAPSIPNKGTYFAYVSADNVVTVRYANNDLTVAKDPSSGLFKVRVFK